MKRALYTIGYESRQQDDALQRLSDAGVEVLVDVRELAQSRVRGFSKTALASALEGRGIEYRHEPSLGSPRELRHTLHESGDFVAFTRGYLLHLKRQGAVVRQIQQLAYGRTCCLLCFEKDHRQCHRQFVAMEIKTVGRNGLEIIHL